MSPEMTLKSVVFPAPLGPRMARRSPCPTSRSTSRTASRPPNRRPTPRRRRIGSAVSVTAAPPGRYPTVGTDWDLPSHGAIPLLALRRVAARGRRRRAERAPEGLVDLRDAGDRLHGQLAVLRDQLLGVDVGHRLAVRVELDLAVGRGQRGLADGLLQRLLVAGQVALDRLQALDQTPGVHEVAVRERARGLRGRRATGRDRLEPLADDVVGVALRPRRVQVAGRAGTADVRAGDARAELLELARGAPEQVPDELLGVDRALGLLVGLQERDEARAAHGDERAVDVGLQLLRVGRVVRRVQRREDPLDDLAARGAELGDEARRRRPAEAVVVGDHRRRPPPELVVGDVAQAGVPLRAVPVEAEEVRGPHLERRVLRARGAVDERLGRVLLGVVGHGDRLVAGERADHDVGTELLHEPPGLLDRRVGAIVRAADPDDLDRVVADGAARHAVTRLVRVLRLGPRELREGRDDARQVLVVERAEGALAVRQDADLDRRARAARARRDGRLRRREVRRGGGRLLRRRARAAARRRAAALVVVVRAAARHDERGERDQHREDQRTSLPSSSCVHLSPLPTAPRGSGSVGSPTQRDARLPRRASLTLRVSARRTPFRAGVVRAGRPEPGDEQLPEADEAVRGQQDDHQEDHADQRVERSPMKPMSWA